MFFLQLQKWLVLALPAKSLAVFDLSEYYYPEHNNAARLNYAFQVRPGMFFGFFFPFGFGCWFWDFLNTFLEAGSCGNMIGNSKYHADDNQNMHVMRDSAKFADYSVFHSLSSFGRVVCIS
jgi:hypothetical protein